MEESFESKKCRCYPSKNGYLTPKSTFKTQKNTLFFSMYAKKVKWWGFITPNTLFDRIWPYVSLLLGVLKQNRYYVVVFRGQIPIFWWVTPIFSLKRVSNGYFITLAQKRGPSTWKNGQLTPKCDFRTPIPHHRCLGGQMPVFWWLTPILVSLNHVFNWFGRLLREKWTFWMREWAFDPKLRILQDTNFFQKFIFT